MTRREDRQILMAAIAEACAAGARLAPACSLAGIDLRTFQRWRDDTGQVRADRRPEATRPRPQHALSEAERARMVELANQPRFASTPPARIVPALADEGVYVASEASFHRVLRDHGQMQRRGRARPPRSAGPPSTHVATAPGQVWCWDVTLILSAKSESCQWSQRYVRSGRWRAHSSGSARYCLYQFAEGSLQLSLPPNAGAFLGL
jgi:putative transposase